MKWAFGVIGWSPLEFWSATPIELEYAIQGWKLANGFEEEETAPNGLSKSKILSKSQVQELKELMEEHGG